MPFTGKKQGEIGSWDPGLMLASRAPGRLGCCRPEAVAYVEGVGEVVWRGGPTRLPTVTDMETYSVPITIDVPHSTYEDLVEEGGLAARVEGLPCPFRPVSRRAVSSG